MLKKLSALVICFVMLFGTMSVSAAEIAKETLYLQGVLANSEVKAARIPNTTRNIVLFDLEDNGIKTLCYCLSSEEGDHLSAPSSIMDDYTWDMQPFLFTDETKSNNNIIITWTNSNKR